MDEETGTPIAVTTNPGGAGKWKEEFSPYLKEKKVVIIVDNDDAGIDHVDEVRESVSPCASEVRLVILNNFSGKDVSDFLEEKSKEELLQQIKDSPPLVGVMRKLIPEDLSPNRK